MIINGSPDSDSLIGGLGDDVLNGAAGNDTLTGGADADTLNGGEGFDTASYSDASGGVSVSLALAGEPQNTGAAGVDTLISIESLLGSFYGDSLVGSAQRDTLAGSGGSDTLRGGEGDDHISDSAATPADTRNDGANDQLYGDAGADTLTVIRTGSAAATSVLLDGGVGDDSLLALSKRYLDSFTLLGGEGADQIYVDGLFESVVVAGSGDDQVYVDARGGAHDVTLGDGADWLILQYGNMATQVLPSIVVQDFDTGPGGDRFFFSQYLYDQVSGLTPLSNYFYSWSPFESGHARLIQVGEDSVLQVDYDGVTGAQDFTDLVTFRNTPVAALNNFAPPSLTLNGSEAGDFLIGGANSDLLQGFGGADYLIGGDGRDTLRAGVGNDTLSGGIGQDTAQFDGAWSDYSIQTNAFGQTVVEDLRTGSPDGVDTLAGVEYLLFSDLKTAIPSRVYAFNPSGGQLNYDSFSSYGAFIGGDGDDTLNMNLPLGPNLPRFTVSDDGLSILGDIDGDGDSEISIAAVEHLVLSGTWAKFSGDFSKTGLAEQGITFNSLATSLLDASGLISAHRITALGSGSPDIFQSGAGDDRLSGWYGADWLEGGGGNDILRGEFGNDTLIGGAGDNLLYGDGDDDRLHVSQGADTAFGGDGNDLFQYGVSLESAPPLASDIVVDGGDGIDTLDFGLVSLALDVDLSAKGSMISIGFGRLNHTGVENLWGGAGNERLVGDGGANLLSGRTGDDTLLGANGEDTLMGGAGDDSLDGDSGVDTASYAGSAFGVTVSLALATAQDTLGEGVDTLRSIEVILGSAHADSLTGAATSDTLNGAAGDDTLDGGLGRDSLIGGAGDDLYRIDNSLDVIVEGFGSGTDTAVTSVNYVLAAGLSIDRLEAIAGSANLNLTGNEYAQVLVGNAGINTLDGKAGADTLIGGSGNDTYIADSSGDQIIELAGEGFDTVRTTATAYVMGANLEVLVYTGTAAFKGAGNDLANVITGGVGIDLLDGGTGADRLVGLAGNDTYIVDNLADVIVENAAEGLDTVKTAIAAYSLGANVENLSYIGADAFQGFGNGLVNVITGGAGNDTLDGRAGADRLVGGLGDDVYFTDHVGDAVVELAGQGADRVLTTLNSAKAADNIETLIFIGAGNFQGYANAADSSVFGAAGKDTLVGGSGGDLLAGMAGNDTLTGGGGADLFYFDSPLASQGVDRITDFVAGVDHIQLRANGFGVTSAADLGFVAGQSPVAADAKPTLLYNTATGVLFFDATGGDNADQVQIAILTSKPTLTSGDFLVV